MSGRRRKPADVNIDRIVFAVALVLTVAILAFTAVHVVSGDL